MKEVRSFYVPDALTATELPPDEAMHALRVLRMKIGDEMVLMDGQGNYYRAEVTLAHTKHCLYEIKEQMPQERQWQGHIHLAIAPTKMMERIEWMTEKAVEVGVDEISFLNCHTKLNEIVTFDTFIQQPREGRKYIAHCYEEVPRTYLFDELQKSSVSDETTVLIGPEGDFSIDEVRQAVDAGFISVHLGKSRLRTETAGLSAVMMMQLAKER